MPLTSTPELILKATPPRLSRHLRNRARLACGSGLPAGRRVVLLQAPGGFGKTSLLSQWRREWQARGARVAWLTVDERDVELRFLAGLFAALDMTGGDATPRWQQRGTGGDLISGMTAWLAEVTAGPGEWVLVLVLDDVHRLPVDTVRNALAYLLANAPANLTLAIATRTALPLPLAALRAYGHAVLIDPNELRLQPQESLELLRVRFGARIDAEACARLHELTEGWPLGLQLLISTIERSADLNGMAARLAARPGRAVELGLLQGLLDSLGEDDHRFLIRIAVVARIDASLAQGLTGRSDAGRLLAQLMATTPIFAESEGACWLRIHPLVREHLLVEQDAWPKAEVRELHMRAATLLDARGLHQGAAYHALAAGESDWAYDLAERCLYELMVEGKMAAVIEWLDRIPPAEVQKRPRLCLAAGWSLALSQHHAEAQAQVLPMYQSPGTAPLLRAEAACILSAASHYADQPQCSWSLLEPWLPLLESASDIVHGSVVLNRAALALYKGDARTARFELTRMRYADRGQMDTITGRAAWMAGRSYLCEGRPAAAEAHFRTVLARADGDTGRRSQIAVMLASGLAMALWELDRADEAGDLLVHRLDVIERYATPDSIIYAHLVAARVAAQQGAPERARDLLESLCALGETTGKPRLVVVALGEQIRREAHSHHGSNCARLMARMPVRESLPADPFSGCFHLPWLLAASYTAIAQQQFSVAANWLEAAAEVASRIHRGRDAVEVHLLQALVQHRLGRNAEPAFLEAISMARELGLRRIVTDTHPDLAALVRSTTLEAAGEPVSAGQNRASDNRMAGGGLLTVKERDVLDLLARKLSNKEIAGTLGVGEETVKWHLKNLFGKLEAGTRRHAVERAMLLGILPAGG